MLARLQIRLELMLASDTPHATARALAPQTRQRLIGLCTDQVVQLQALEGPASARTFLDQLVRILASPIGGPATIEPRP